ncbi:nucleotidyltransferase family protein [Prochlorococcus sp. MIT 1223]|uniref:nucleotidyltransferase family protein n=1 Tax=Prochlorococcus sp. MIT 1223 TaxID=3096217 RepID=UPI002A748CFD|nr:nucleotidyltransferase family protein [Prochlorococcus sp. MIT 1223]
MSSITALVLCGGKGERLKPLTNSIPKPLIQINKKPILGYIFDHINKYNIEKLIVATGYQSNKIEDYINKNHSNLEILTSHSGDVDIIERIKEASKLIKGDFIIFYGDTLSDVNIDNLIAHHKKQPGNATVTVWPLKSQFGLMEFDSSGMICSFKEKPILDKWINIGYIYCDKSIITMLTKVDKFEDLLSLLVKKKQLNGFKHEGIHITVNTIEELELAEKNIKSIGITP